MSDRPTFPDTEAGARQALRELAVPEVADAAGQLVAKGTHLWRADPSVEGVWGLVRIPYMQTADIVVYCTAGDFEISDTIESLLSP